MLSTSSLHPTTQSRQPSWTHQIQASYHPRVSPLAYLIDVIEWNWCKPFSKKSTGSWSKRYRCSPVTYSFRFFLLRAWGSVSDRKVVDVLPHRGLVVASARLAAWRSLGTSGIVGQEGRAMSLNYAFKPTIGGVCPLNHSLLSGCGLNSRLTKSYQTRLNFNESWCAKQLLVFGDGWLASNL